MVNKVHCGGRKRFREFMSEEDKVPVLIERFVEPCILLQLYKEPNHGYGLLKGHKEICRCEYIDVGNFYRVVRILEQEGMIEPEEKKDSEKRVVYKITYKGKMFLRGWVNSLEKNKELINLFIANYQQVDQLRPEVK